MTSLPANRKRGAKHAGLIFLIGGMESVTRALVMGDGFEDVEGLQEVSRRARALAEAIDTRIEEASNHPMTGTAHIPTSTPKARERREVRRSSALKKGSAVF